MYLKPTCPLLSRLYATIKITFMCFVVTTISLRYSGPTMLIKLLYTSRINYRLLCVPEIFVFHWFFQMNNILNPHSSLLNFVFTNNNFIFVDATVPPNSYNPPLSLTFQFTFLSCLYPYFRSFNNFQKSVFPRITNFYTSYNWERTLLYYNADEAMTVLYDALHYAISLFVLFVNDHKSSYLPWFIPKLRKLVFKKNYAQVKYKSSIDQWLSQIFITLHPL